MPVARFCANSAGPGVTGDLVLRAADHNGKAFSFYADYLAEVRGDDPVTTSLHDRVRSPQRIAVIAPLLKQGIAAEEAGLKVLQKAVASL